MNAVKKPLYFVTLALATMLALANIAIAHNVSTVRNATLSFPTGDSADVVDLIRGNGKPGYITVCLEAAPNITWWKGIDVLAGPNRVVASLWTQDGKKTDCATIATGDIAPNFAKLRFSKAKAFGVHTEISRKPYNPWAYDGKSMTFYWKQD